MSGLTLTLRQAPRQALDLSPLLPERLAGLDAKGIAAIGLAAGNRTVALGEVFTVSAGDPADLCIRNDGAILDFIGKGMTGGKITVEGTAGAYAGLGLKGGSLHIRGDAGPWAGAEMRDGVIEIDGDAGDLPGGALPGAMRGMSGGLMLVRGAAGERAGDRMRRGLLVIEGNVGGYAGSRMIAGTLAALGEAAGPYPGFAMRRGSVILTRTAERMLPTFADCGRHELGFLRLLPQALQGHSSRLAAFAAKPPRMRRLAGDAATGGKGEILIRED